MVYYNDRVNISGLTLFNRVYNEAICDKVGACSQHPIISDVEATLVWVRPYEQWGPTNAVRKCIKEMIGQDLTLLYLVEDIHNDRALWRVRTKVEG